MILKGTETLCRSAVLVVIVFWRMPYQLCTLHFPLTVWCFSHNGGRMLSCGTCLQILRPAQVVISLCGYHLSLVCWRKRTILRGMWECVFENCSDIMKEIAFEAGTTCCTSRLLQGSCVNYLVVVLKCVLVVKLNLH